MNVEDMIKNALNPLTNDGIFYIDRVDYDEKNFGNIYVVLSSNNQIDIRFIKDRGVFRCEVGQAGEWYFIEDVLTLIGVTIANKSTDLVDFITEMATLMKRNISRIFQAFNAQNSKDTQIKIKALATKRAMGMFKQ